MRTKDEFRTSKWHLILVGLATMGKYLEENGTALDKAQKHANVGEQMSRLMDELYDYLANEKGKK